ncbi:MAG: hypothetical protein K8F30_10655 [Taibaiella sp.]|nr:hypothetical protein [Taibaiella sp.]
MRFTYNGSGRALNILLLLIVIASCSCGKTRRSYKVSGEFRYYNRLDDTIRVVIKLGLNKAFESYIVPAGDSVVITTVGETDLEGPVDPKGYAPGILADTTSVIFNDTLCYNEYHKSGTMLHDIDSYTYLKRGDKDYLFFFNIDSNLYRMAGACF